MAKLGLARCFCFAKKPFQDTKFKSIHNEVMIASENEVKNIANFEIHKKRT